MLVTHGDASAYQKFRQDQLRTGCEENAISKLSVKESAWPVELFYTKVVNTFKKK